MMLLSIFAVFAVAAIGLSFGWRAGKVLHELVQGVAEEVARAAIRMIKK